MVKAGFGNQATPVFGNWPQDSETARPQDSETRIPKLRPPPTETRIPKPSETRIPKLRNPRWATQETAATHAASTGPPCRRRIEHDRNTLY